MLSRPRITALKWPIAAYLALCLLLPAAALLPFVRGDSGVPQHPPVDRVLHVGFTVRNLDRSIDFFTHALDFKKTSETELQGPEFEHATGLFAAHARRAQLTLGDETIELTEYFTPRGRDIPLDARSNDGIFQHIAIITSDMDRAYARLRDNHVQHVSSSPQTLPNYLKNAAGIHAFYFKDPDNHILEVLQFPADKGEPRWHATDHLFLGIDHTAIGVADTEKSLAFYRDQLGLTIAGTSENFGNEQEHLNAVFGAHLRIATLRAPAPGPKIEFLQYLAPTDGKPFPADTRPNDLWHWEITLQGTAQNITRDPDGHAIIVTPPAPIASN